MTETEIIKVLARWVHRQDYPFQLPNAFIYKWECDYWALSANGETREFEIKCSRQDFLIDKKKEKHRDCTLGANYFYYVCPAGIISKKEVAPGYGLIYIMEYGGIKTLELVKRPRKLHNREFDGWKMLANKMYWKWHSLWEQKFKAKEITIDEWRAGNFNMSLGLFEKEGE